jgi:hypothetical protein
MNQEEKKKKSCCEKLNEYFFSIDSITKASQVKKNIINSRQLQAVIFFDSFMALPAFSNQRVFLKS